MQTQEITYFTSPGKQNTDETLRLAIEAAREGEMDTMVVASTTGDTAQKAAQMVADEDITLVIIPHQYGWAEEPEFDLDLIPELEEQGHIVHFATMLFHTYEFYGTEAPTALANILRTFGQGTKVCVEILLMAADAGLVTPDEQVVAVAGTGRGADTAVIATASPSIKIKQMKIHRILCKPSLE